MKPFRFTIRKKVFLLTAALSIALILVSVTISSSIFSNRIKNEAVATCRNSAEVLSDYLSDYEMALRGDGTMTSFITYYKNNLDLIYSENREEIERTSALQTENDEAFAQKKEFFTSLTGHLFAKSAGFGLSYDILSFTNSYAEVIEEMERMASLDGVLYCEAFYYDDAHGNLVFLCDSTSEKDLKHSFPGSVMKAPDSFIEGVYQSGEVTVISQDDEFAGYAPVKIDGDTVAYVSFDYSVDRLVDLQRGFIWTLIAIMLIATAAILVIYLLLADRWLVKSVTRLSEAARTFTSHMDSGEIRPVSAVIGTKDEIKDLSDDFYALQNKVIAYSDDIAKKRAAEERMQAELGIASKIQMQSLPDKPLVSEHVRISSFIKPAKEVGGDLFDYFLLEEGKIFFVIADVSGKGVPAALFMMRGKEIIRYCAKAGMNAAKIAETANRELCRNNKEGLFITAFIGVYDCRTNLLTFARAGHEQPFLLRGGKAEKFSEESNFVLGAFDNMPFVEDSLQIKDGDRILFYTDGLNEGINEANEEFGYDRIKETLERSDSDLLASLYDNALSFSGGAQQFDDITMLLFECVKSKVITLHSPTFDDIPIVTEQINDLVKGYDGDKTAELDVIVDEMLNNYISYAFNGVKKPLLTIDVSVAEGVARLTFTDNGMLFDPLQIELPDLELDLKDRPEGGMGIMIVRSIADKISYRVFEGQNRLSIVKDLKASPEESEGS